MKLLMVYVEKSRQSKSFIIKASCVVATIFAIIGLATNLTNEMNYSEGILISLALWVVWFFLWILFTKQIIKVSAKIKERNLKLEEEEKRKEKVEKRKLAEERANSKKNKK